VADARAAVAAYYPTLVLATYEDALAGAQALQAAIDAFVANPTAQGFENCKELWLANRLVYGQTESFRFYGGPIDDSEGPEGFLNAWPVDEAMVDYVVDAQGNRLDSAGIINRPDLYPVLSDSLLLFANGQGGETNVTTGYHVLEFLLWGQDLSPTGPGQRPYTDYLDGGTAPNPARRRQYLQRAAHLLVLHLAQVRDAWKNEPGTYRTSVWNHLSNPNALKNMLQGIGALCHFELRSERLEVALTLHSQEDEHSCFSDNTHNDVWANVLACHNVYYGTYAPSNMGPQLTGASLSAVAHAQDHTLAQQLDAAFAATQAAAADLRANAPFDQLILASNAAGNAKVQALIDALATQGQLLAQLAARLGVTINISGHD
jgi:putative iron-regulated protein